MSASMTFDHRIVSGLPAMLPLGPFPLRFGAARRSSPRSARATLTTRLLRVNILIYKAISAEAYAGFSKDSRQYAGAGVAADIC